MRYVKIMKQDENGQMISDSYPCVHYTVRETPADSLAAREGLSPAGVTIELGPPTRRSFHVPTDGEVIYITNEDGKTAEKYPKDYKPPVKRENGDKDNVETESGRDNKAEFRTT